MELSEVVSAHFAFPVVGVVLCAVLVFAFGFKSPAQPPSFDLLEDDDDRKYKKSRQKKHKLNIDGHVINIDGHGSPGAKVMTKQQTTLNRQTTNEKQDPQVTKVKTKKPKPVTETGVVNENLPEQDEDAGATGEWTKAVSKKDRKNRSKKDDGSRKDDFPAAAERTSPSHEIQKTVQVTHPTVNSRDEVCSNRTQRRTLEVTVTAPAPAPVPVFPSCTAVPAGFDSASVNPDSFSSKVKATAVSVTIASTFKSEPQKSAITSQEQTIKTSSPASIPKPLQPTPGKVSEAVDGNVIQLPGEDDAKVPSVSVAVTTDVKNPAEDKTSEKGKDYTATVTVGDSKPARSPKKKKKSPESREKYKESPVVTIPADVTVFSTTVVTAEPRPIVKPVNSDTPTEETQTVTNRSASAAEASTSCVQCSPLRSDDRSAEKTCPTTADNNLPLSDSKTTSGGAHPVSDSKTTAGVAHPASDSKTTAGVIHPATDSKTTAGVVHPASDIKTTAGVVHPATDNKTTAGVTHPATDSKTTVGVTHPTSDPQPMGDLQPADENCLGGDSQPPALADELGDWQEAKPLKKKRKPHREN